MSTGGAMGGGRSFVDATGTPVPLRGPIRTVVATDPEVGVLLAEIGATVIGCAGRFGEVPVIGDDRRPDAREVAALRPDAVITGTRDGRHDLADPTIVEALQRTAPVIAIDLARAAVARAELRALLGSTSRRAVPPPIDPLGELDPYAAPDGHRVADLGPRLAAVVRHVASTGHPAVLTDGGREVAAIIDIADYRRLHELIELVNGLRLK
jgi:prevent-host-death family protein